MLSSLQEKTFYRLYLFTGLLLWCTASAAQITPRGSSHFEISPYSPIQQDKIQDENLADEAQTLRQIEELDSKLEYEAAILLAERLLSIREKGLGPNHHDTIKIRLILAPLYMVVEDYVRAKQLLSESLETGEKTLGGEHLTVAETLLPLATVYRQEGADDKAEVSLTRALKIREGKLGPDHQDVAEVLVSLASLYHDKESREKAEPLYKRALAIYEKSLGPDDLKIAAVLVNLSGLLRADKSRSDELLDRALEIFEKAASARNPDAPDYLHTFAEKAEEADLFELARAMYLRTLSLCQQLPGSEPMTALVLNNLAELYRNDQRYDEAKPLYLKAISMNERVHGPNHPTLAVNFNNLGLLYKQNKEYDLTEPLYLRALAIYEQGPRLNQRGITQTHFNLARLYFEKGEYRRAISKFERVVELTRDGPQVELGVRLVSLLHLAALYEIVGNIRRAAAFLNMAQAEAKKSRVSEWDVGLQLIDIAALFLQHNSPERAEQILRRALAVSRDIGPPHHVLTTLYSIGNVYRMKGNYFKAESFYRQALKRIAESDYYLFWDPDVGIILGELAILHQARGETTQAIKALIDSSQITQHNLRDTLAMNEPSDPHNPYSMLGLREETNTILSLQALHAPRDVALTRLALLALLARKGRILEILSDRMRQMQNSPTPEAGAVLQKLRLLHAKLGAAVLNGPVNTDPFLYQARVAELEWRLGKLESRDMPDGPVELINDLYSATLEKVQKNIPSDAALVEIALYTRMNFKHSSVETMWGEKRYVAYVLHSAGEPRGVDLGDAKQIDRAVVSFREALRDPQRADVRDLARALDEKVMRPIRALLKDKKMVLVSPDGALNLIPFAALVDEQGDFLVKRYSFTYLTSGRDLLKLKQSSPSKQGPVIVADPDYGELASPRPKKGTGPRGPDLSEANFKPLPGTAEEARALKELLPEAVLLVKGDATEARVKSVEGPRILHIATHGFFLGDTQDDASSRPDTILAADGARDLTHQSPTPPGMRIENLLLRSGLGLAGANLHRSSEDDGLLTALEVSGLKLTGTKLVVLSACDTGVGEVLSGDGVYGLRRALLLAGAESQIISLWPVSDRNTRDLMIDYYKALQEGEGRSAALRHVQLRLLSSQQQSHPFYWASFIQSGKWTDMNDER